MTKRPCVLCVDDDAAMRIMLQDILTVHGFDVQTASTAQRGIEIVRTHPVDVIVADLHMPMMDGFEFISILQGQDATRSLPILVLTADASEDALFHGLELGAVDHMTKPFKSRELVLRLRSKIRLREDAIALASSPPAPVLLSSTEKFLMRLRHVLDTMYSLTDPSPFTPAEVAHRLAMSVPTLHRMMRRTTGMSLGEWMLIHRLERAKIMIEARVGTLTEVAYATGFRTASHFSTAFRRQFGLSPSAYRDELWSHRSRAAVSRDRVPPATRP